MNMIQHSDGVLLNGSDHAVKHIKCGHLVLNNRISLSISSQTDTLAENLHEFTVVPDISTAEEYGRYIIRESGHFEVDPNLEDYIDYQSYGERRVREDGGLFGDRGYVAYLGTKPEMNEIMARNIPAERMEQGPQMGGLT